MEIRAIAPGRVNLIGEHTDYNQGWVMPMAIDSKLEVKLTLRRDRIIRASAADFQKTEVFNLNQLNPATSQPSWIDYVKGVCWVLEKHGFQLCGAELLIESSIPIGSGLSSSAALELAVAGTLTEAMDFKIDRSKLALMCQEAENSYVGVRCGIMDQYAVGLSRADKVMLLDCSNLKYSFIPLNLGDYKVLIADSRVRRSLGESAYNRRREECETAVSLLNTIFKRSMESLREVSLEDVKTAKEVLPKKLYQRCRFVVEENARVLATASALAENDLISFGYLLSRSHAGLRDLYEVSCPELDLIVEVAQNDHRVLGSRMTGAGFGGCAIILINNEAIKQVCANISAAYSKNGWPEPIFWQSGPAEGLTVIKQI